MASGDGLIVRIRAAAHPLSSHVLRALADLANSYGSGQIEVTRRANLQLRGLREDGLITRAAATADGSAAAVEQT